TSAKPAAVRLLTCGCNCLHRLATEAESGPCPPEYCTVVVTVLPPAPRRKYCHDRRRHVVVLLGSQELRGPWWTSGNRTRHTLVERGSRGCGRERIRPGQRQTTVAVATHPAGIRPNPTRIRRVAEPP